MENDQSIGVAQSLLLLHPDTGYVNATGNSFHYLGFGFCDEYRTRVVVRGRKIGKVIFFQGGTAYNDAVAAAFSSILGQQIIVPPFNGVMGALGVALLAREI